MDKWTKGPLKVVTEHGENGEKLFFSIGEADDSSYRGVVATVDEAEHIGGITWEEAEANAHLYAAAPDLAEALEEMVNVFNLPEDGSGDEELELYFRKPVKKARAALAKAKGE